MEMEIFEKKNFTQILAKTKNFTQIFNKKNLLPVRAKKKKIPKFLSENFFLFYIIKNSLFY